MHTIKGKFDFQAIPTGKFSIKTLTIVNSSKEQQKYETSRDAKTNPLDHVFDVDPWISVLNPGESYVLKLRYAPEVPFYTNVDYFSVNDSNGQYLKIHARGNSIGPLVVASDKRLIFIATPERSNVRKLVELKNESKMEAQYQIDMDSRNCVFKPDKLSGMIGPDTRIFVAITFSPPTPGVYQKNMVVYIHYQRPVLVQLEGISKVTKSPHKAKSLKVVRYSFNARLDSSGESVWTAETQSPPLLVTPSHLDFGSVDIEDELEHAQPITVTNRSRDDVFLKWDEDNEDVFRIQPKSEIIPGGQPVTFQASFNPKKRDLLFAVQLDGRGYWHEMSEHTSITETRDQIQVYVPLSLSVRMMGHSFPEGGYGWMPQSRVCPPSVIMPPCVPPVPVSTTFLIERFGHLPITFRFIPPEFTYLKVSPMQGLIEDARQIVVVEMTPAAEGERAYVERWTVQFNGSPKHETPVDFRGFAEYPYVRVGQENTIRVPSTYRGAERTVRVPVKNLTRHYIRFRYELFEYSNTITIVPPDGTLAPNEAVVHKLHYMSEKTGIQKKRIQIELVALQDCQFPMGPPTNVNVIISAQCEMVTLVAFPKYINCGMILLGQPLAKLFHLFNFGNCPVHFLLKCVQGNACADDVKLSPCSGTVPPDSNLEITVSVFPTMLGMQQFSVSYHSTRDGHTLTEDPWMQIMRIDYEGMTPTMTIQDLKYNCAGPLFTKVCIWKMMRIVEFNEALRSGLPDTKAHVTLNFPEAPVGTHAITVYLYLKNNCFFATEWRFRSLQNCGCKRMRRALGQSLSFHGFNCPHRALVTITPTNGILEPKQRLVWEVVANYDLEGSWELSYVLELPNNRQIFINAHVVAYSESKPVLSMYSPTLELSNIFVGDLYPTTQMFWLYNNSYKDAKYFVDTLPIRNLMIDEFRVQVLKCLNPTGMVKSKSSKAIYFKFNPYEFKNYQVQLPINLGNAVTNNNLKVSGDGVVYFESHVRFLHDKAPTHNVTDTPEIPILFSSDNIIIKPFSTNSQVERIFFMKNQTNKSYEYTWHEYTLENILQAAVSPATGILKPKETHECKITLKSNSDPCIITARIHLEAINVNDKYEHEKSLMMYQAIARQMEGEFIITEEGYSKLTPDMKIYPMPEPVYVAVAVACHIYNPIDPDVKFPLRDQMKQRPDPRLCLNQVHPTTRQHIRQEHKNFIVSSLENAIWDTISSKWFERNLGEMNHECKPYYSQFTKHDQEDQKLKRETYNIAPHQLTNNLITDLAYQLMHEIFDFDTVNKESSLQQKEADHNQEDTYDGESQPKSILKIKVPFGW